MLTKLLLTLSLLLASFLSYGNIDEERRWLNLNLPKYEATLLDKLENTPKKNHFLLYLLAARKLYSYELYNYAEKYYAKAVKEYSESSKKEAYYRLFQLAFKRGDEKALKSYLIQAKYYFSQYKKFREGKTDSIIAYFESELSHNDKKIIEVPKGKNGTFARKVFEHNYYAHFKNGDYKNALELLHPGKVKYLATIERTMEFDLLKLLVEGKESHKELACQKTYEKYKTSYDYSVISCGILIKYVQEGVLEKADIDKLKKYFEKFDRDMAFITEALLKLDA